MSHRRIRRSAPAVANIRPSGRNAEALTQSVCDFSDAGACRVWSVEHPHQMIVADGGQELSGRVDRHARDDRAFFSGDVGRRQFDDPTGGNLGDRFGSARRRATDHAGQPSSTPDTIEKDDFRHIHHLKLMAW